jgi:hypothetical protein
VNYSLIDQDEQLAEVCQKARQHTAVAPMLKTIKTPDMPASNLNPCQGLACAGFYFVAQFEKLDVNYSLIDQDEQLAEVCQKARQHTAVALDTSSWSIRE